jgi:hypothetical protein
MNEPRVSVTVKIKGQNHADACYYMKEIIHCDSVPPNQSDRHTTFRFWNITAIQHIQPNKWILHHDDAPS